MTDAFFGWLIIGGLFAVWALFTRKKTPPVSPARVYAGIWRFELVEIVRPVVITPKPKLGMVGWIAVIICTVILVAILHR